MTDVSLPPLCPVCGGTTHLKEMHRSPRGDGFSCFFRCDDCGTHYPRMLSAADVHAAGFLAKPPTDDTGHDPAP